MHDVPRKTLSTVIQSVITFLKTLIPNAVNNNFQNYHHRISSRPKNLPTKSSEICLSDNHQNFQVKLINLDTVFRSCPYHTQLLPIIALFPAGNRCYVLMNAAAKFQTNKNLAQILIQKS